MIARLFRIKHRPLTQGPLAEAERIVREESDRREAAFEAAVSEMGMARLDTETILDLYLSRVTS